MKPFVLAALLLAPLATPALAEDLSGIPSIVDGDTIDLQGIRIRLHGIDAPEAGQKCKATHGGSWKCGEAAMDRLASMAQDGVTCNLTGGDKYDRWLAICRLDDGTDINKVMVEEGYAWAFRRYSDDYASAEDTAKSLKTGIWQTETETAWDYRAASGLSPNSSLQMAALSKATSPRVARSTMLRGHLGIPGQR